MPNHRVLIALFLRYFWVLPIVLSLLYVLAVRFGARQRLAEDAEMSDAFGSFARGILLWGNLPWVVMGFGVVVGGVPTVFHFLDLSGGDPYVLAFVASAVFLWFAVTVWTFRGGAEMLAKYPELGGYGLPVRNASFIKVTWVLGIVGGVAALVLFSSGKIPLDKLLESVPK